MLYDIKAKTIKRYEPKIVSDRISIDNYFKKNRGTIMIDIKHLNRADGQAVIDYICGTVFAYSGSMHKVSNTVYKFVIMKTN